MTTYNVSSFSELVTLINRHARQRESRVRAAARRATSKGRVLVKRNVPVAFGELRESVHDVDTFIIVDAPHAAAVNLGSRPHWVPIDALVAWVKLRGTQGLLTERQQNRLPGTTTKSAALGVAGMLREHETRGPASFSPTDAVVEVARKIQYAIAHKGTRPHHFMEKSLPGLAEILGAELRTAIAQPPSGGVVVQPSGGPPGAGGGGGGGKPSSTSGAYRKNAGTFRGAAIQTNSTGQKFVQQKNGKVVFLRS